MQLYHSGRLTLAELISRFTIAPARLLNLPKGTLSPGADGDVTIFDPNAEWVFSRERTASKSFNSPFYDWLLKGRCVATVVAGKLVWQDQESSASLPSR
jgi:dihydroorotase